MTQPTTIGALRETGYRPKTVKEELRGNLIAALAAKREMFKGIVGYETTVIPQIENAILSGQDIIFLGERGQAKTRIARRLIELLDETVPAIAGCEINDDPFAPICAACKYRVANDGDSVELVWLTPDLRYSEKLATPDISIADLIGEVDPIKVAEGRYLSDEMTIHYGLVPRTHRGIFTLNELPDLAERVQVGLLNVMEERDVQIRGYKVRLPLDLFVVASANPEDYTNRGRIITPLKDRFGSQIRTHYPKEIATEVGIMEQERQVFVDEGITTVVPAYMKELLAEISQLARRSPEISQRSPTTRPLSRPPSSARCAPERRASSHASAIFRRSSHRRPGRSSSSLWVRSPRSASSTGSCSARSSTSSIGRSRWWSSTRCLRRSSGARRCTYPPRSRARST
jgi:magnesium chelatase subunit I